MDKKRYKLLLIYLLLVVAIITAYEPMRHNDFISYDDSVYVTDNPHITAGLTAKSVIWAFASPHAHMYHPLTTLSHMLDCELFGLEPLWHHAGNLLFHTLSTLLLFWLLKRMTGAIWASAFAAAVFALHPLQVESVAWAAERKSVLSGFFWILTIAAYVRYVERPGAGRYLLVVFVYVLALLSKPVVVTLPFALLLLDYWPLGRLELKAGKNEVAENPLYKQFSAKHLLLEKLPLFILSAILSVITFLAQRGGDIVSSLESLSVRYRFANAFISYLKYIEKFIWPHKLAVLYPHPGELVSKIAAIFCALVLILLTAILIGLTRRKKYLTVGWLWFVGTLVPVIGIVQSGAQAMADRYMYIPIIGLLIMITWAVRDITEKLKYRTILVTFSSAVVLLAAVICTRRQVGYWRNSRTIFEHTLNVTENNVVAHNGIGCFYQQTGQYEKAIKHFRDALQINSANIDVMNNLSILLLKEKKTDEAMEYLKKVLQLNSRNVKAINNLGKALYEKDRIDEAMEKWQQVLTIEPGHPNAHRNIGAVMFRNSKYSQAIEHFKNALDSYIQANKLRPGNASIMSDMAETLTILNNLGKTSVIEGRPDEAIECFQKLLTINKDSAEVYFYLGLAYSQKNEHDQAIKHFKQALEIDPNHVEAHCKLGQVFLLAGQNDSAIECFNEALRLNDKRSDVYGSLGMAYMNKGRSDLAVNSLNQAIKLEPDSSEALNNLAWILAAAKDSTLRNPTKAVELALRACELTDYEDPLVLDTLAVAYASAGRFSDAVKTAEQAVNLAELANRKDIAEQIKQHLFLYQAGKPYYDK